MACQFYVIRLVVVNLGLTKVDIFVRGCVGYMEHIYVIVGRVVCTCIVPGLSCAFGIVEACCCVEC